MSTALQWDAALTRRGITLIPHQPQPDEVYWKLVRAEYWQEKEHVFVETLNQYGDRLPGSPVRFWWAGGEEVKTAYAKPGERWMVDFPMFNAGKSYGVEVQGYNSDKVWGMGLGTPEQPDWKIHVSWKLTFQLVTAPAEAEPEPAPQPEQPGAGFLPLWWDGVNVKVRLPDGSVKTLVVED